MERTSALLFGIFLFSGKNKIQNKPCLVYVKEDGGEGQRLETNWSLIITIFDGLIKKTILI